MSRFIITVDGRPVEVAAGETVLAAARRLGIDVPTLCYLERCGPLNSCQVCLVKLDGKLVPSCGTRVEPGMAVESETEEVHEARRTTLELLFSDHVGDCLSPCHRLCPLLLNIPLMLRQIEAGRLDEAIATVRGALPLPAVLGRLCHHPCEQGCRRGHWDEPAAIRDMERFVADQDLQRPEPYLPACQPSSGKCVAIVGAGATGLAAAYDLVRDGHGVTVLDRRAQPGGTLRDVAESELPVAALDGELRLFERFGIEFRSGIELGRNLSLDQLATQYDAVLLAVGELRAGDAEKIDLPTTGTMLRADPNTCQTAVANVFAAGSAVRPQKNLVRALAEGRAAAECIRRFLRGKPVRRPEKPFSSVMGRLAASELREFLARAGTQGRMASCSVCRTPSEVEARLESARCLHCDCSSSGNCVLQHYAQVYGADANRFRGERRPFEQQRQPGGIVFEPGKCIVCGICVRLTELAAEPLGLTFIGRGFNVRVAAPFNRSIQEGLTRVAAECVRHCPTGALAFDERLSATP